MRIRSLKNKAYKNLIEYASNNCDTVMFITRTDGFLKSDINKLNRTMENMQNKLQSSFMKLIHRPTWVFHESLDNQFDKINNEQFINQFNIYFYKFTNEVKEYLLSNQNLYNWLNPDFPEDISFFKKNKCWLSSVTHEEICEIYVESKEEYKTLKELGIEFDEKNYRKILKEEIYFEEVLEEKI